MDPFFAFDIDDDKYEVYIDNINNGGNKDGWIPHFIFAKWVYSQKIRIARIDKSWYGIQQDIAW